MANLVPGSFFRNTLSPLVGPLKYRARLMFTLTLALVASVSLSSQTTLGSVDLTCCREDVQIDRLIALGFSQIHDGIDAAPLGITSPSPGNVSRSQTATFFDYTANVFGLATAYTAVLSDLGNSSGIDVTGYLTNDEVCSTIASTSFNNVLTQFAQSSDLEVWYHVLQVPGAEPLLFYRVSDKKVYFSSLFPSSSPLGVGYQIRQNLSPCITTRRFACAINWEDAWPGIMEHAVIQSDYGQFNPSTYLELGIPGSSSAGNCGYADIADPDGGHIFEIKPDNGSVDPLAQLGRYVGQANALCPGGSSNFSWIPGTKYFPLVEAVKTYPYYNADLQILTAYLETSGVVVYNYIDTDDPRLEPDPVLIPERERVRFRDFLQYVRDNFATIDLELEIQIFLHDNPGFAAAIAGIATGIIIATILEDFATLGAGIADDPASFSIAFALYRVALRAL